MSAFCYPCYRDQDTGELFCSRLGEWVKNCPNFPDGYPWDAEKETNQDDDENENEEGYDE